MLRSRPLIWVASAALTVAAGCGSERPGPSRGDILIDRVVSTFADSLSVPAWSVFADGIEVRVADIAGFSSCYSLEGMDIDIEGRRYDLVPLVRHRQYYGYACYDMIVYFDTTFVVHPPDTGLYWFHLRSDGDTLVDSTAVLLEAQVPASVDALIVSAWSLLEDGIDVRLMGTVDAPSRYSLLEVEIGRDGRTYTLSPLARPAGKEFSLFRPAATSFDTTFSLHPPEIGPYWIRVVTHRDTLVDSTKVK